MLRMQFRGMLIWKMQVNNAQDAVSGYVDMEDAG